jgi:hypothetical protein
MFIPGRRSPMPAQLAAGRAWEAERLSALGVTSNTGVWRPTVANTQSSAFQIIVGQPRYTGTGLPVGTIVDAMPSGLLEIKGGTSALNSSYQLRLQTYRALIEQRPLIIETSRPLNPTFQVYCEKWGVKVVRPTTTKVP